MGTMDPNVNSCISFLSQSNCKNSYIDIIPQPYIYNIAFDDAKFHSLKSSYF